MSTKPAKYLAEEEDPEVSCIYNSAHYVRESKYASHLEGCRNFFLEQNKNLPDSEKYAYCKYNRTHQVPRRELKFHELRCCDQFGCHNMFSNPLKHDAVLKYLDEPEPSEPNFGYDDYRGVQPSEEDNWVLTPGGPQFDPQKKLNEEFTYVIPKGLTPSARKEWIAKNVEKAKSIPEFKGVPTKLEKKVEDMTLKDNSNEEEESKDQEK